MYFIFISFGLLTSYIGFLLFESRRGTRFLVPHRVRLDRTIERSAFIFAHVDFASFAHEEAKRFTHRLTHDVAHLSLTSVRILERLLTRLVRHLRAKSISERTPQESARSFVRTLSEFKGQIKATRPDVSEIP